MKKIEYYLNLIFYSILCFLQIGTRIFDYCVSKPLDAFFYKFVPKRFHPPGIKHPELRKEWNERSDIAFASNSTFSFLFINTFVFSLLILYEINNIVGLNEVILWILSFLFALSWNYITDIFIFNNDKYLNYLQIFEKKSAKWKRKCTIWGFLIILETIFFPITVWYIGYILYNQ